MWRGRRRHLYGEWRDQYIDYDYDYSSYHCPGYWTSYYYASFLCPGYWTSIAELF
jgi:hypothetical protein